MLCVYEWSCERYWSSVVNLRKNPEKEKIEKEIQSDECCCSEEKWKEKLEKVKGKTEKRHLGKLILNSPQRKSKKWNESFNSNQGLKNKHGFTLIWNARPNNHKKLLNHVLNSWTWFSELQMHIQTCQVNISRGF